METTIVSIRDRLLKEREALLDLSTRNRLLNTPLRTRNVRTIEIVDEKPTEVLRMLNEGRNMTFLPGMQLSDENRALLEEGDKETGAIPQPAENEQFDERGVAARHADTRLQTRLTSEGLQKRLFDIWYDARTLEEEQGVNILYLAIGLLRWYEADNSDVSRHAPLVLLPVSLERSSVAERFHLKGRSEPPSPNITLQAKLKVEFGIQIDDFDDEDDLDLPAYIAKIASSVSAQKRWEVLPDAMVLGFYSFSKFLMYRDLDPENWPQASSIDYHPLVSGLLRDGFPETDPLIPDNEPVDNAIPPSELNHVVDADSSQAVAIAEAVSGRTVVVKGPPGTGKSQTITNIIAAAAAKGRKILFVSEKMAALDVVHRRLKECGLGPLTLELHSNKINKRAVLEELKRTKEAGNPPIRTELSVVQKLGDVRDELSAYANQLHRMVSPCGLTPYQILGRLVAASSRENRIGFDLTGAESWRPEEYSDRLALVDDISSRLRELGSPAVHPWRGVGCDALDPMETEALLGAVSELRQALAASIESAGTAVSTLEAPALATVADIYTAERYLSAARSFPPSADLAILQHPAWSRDLEQLERLVQTGKAYSDARARVENVLSPAGWDADFSEIRISIVTHGSSLFRWLNGEYRKDIKLLRSYLKSELPGKSAERLALVDNIMAAQNARKAFNTAPQLGDALGALWKSDKSDWNALQSLVDWRKSVPLPAEAFARLGKANRSELLQTAVSLSQNVSRFLALLSGVESKLQPSWLQAFGRPTLDAVDIGALGARLELWLSKGEALSKYIAFAGKVRKLGVLGAKSISDAIFAGQLAPHDVRVAFENSYTLTLRAVLFSSWPALKAFDGDGQNNLVERFRQLDRARIRLAKEQIAAKHAEGRPRAAGGIGPLGVLNAELAKKRGHLPLRQLLERAGPAIQQLKPVFMMSPLSVAQFLRPGSITFDLLVMDEASQIEPVDALGAIARVSQMVVVGDERQLPPTSFFKKLTGEEDAAEDEDGVAIQAKDAESILDLCLAKGVPHRMLSWHYRSKHQSLIAVSNREFYENKLFIVPSPYDAVAGMGLKFHPMRNTAYDRGGTRTNPKEARAVAEAVMAHAKTCPSQTLGVATFSVAQRQAVLKELELLRRAEPALEDFFNSHPSEPFFVKNLENIQGDERDVIFISVGYGKTAEGNLAHAFGPLSADGGERRLNVLISRAKVRCEVFCNFTGADIDLERTRARGVAALKLFLTFAETGNFGLGDGIPNEHDSAFEAQVSQKIRSLGYDVKAQIGASGFRVDLAVSDPEKPGRFVLGIECDGAQYHSSRSARDRDRLRQQVLEAHGWIIHRIWSTDWYLRPSEEIQKLEAAIGAAQTEWKERDEQGVAFSSAGPVSFAFGESGEVFDVTATGGSVALDAAEDRTRYQEAEFPVNRSLELHEVPVADMAAYVVKVVETEGPVHLDEVATRLRTLWGLRKAGSRIRTAVTEAADIAARRGLIVGGEFLQLPGTVIKVRDRSQVTSLGLRKPEMLPPVEIQEAMLKIVDENFGAKPEELIQACSRQFGFSSTSQQLKDVLNENITNLLAAGRLVKKEDLVVKGP